jgi:uncharacterized membrane protein
VRERGLGTFVAHADHFESMTFGYPIPLWAWIVGLLVIAALVYRTYAGMRGLVSPRRRAILMALRAVTLGLLVLFLLDPVIVLPQTNRTDAVVPVLVDNSRSMRLTDVDGRRRIDVAKELVRTTIQPKLDSQFNVEVLTAGDGVAETPLDRISPDARTSDLRGAIAAARERYNGQRIAGIVLLSDGADTGSSGPILPADNETPVFAVGLGAAEVARDREVLGVSVGDPALSDSNVDLSATIVSHGFGAKPADIRVLENGRPVHIRRLNLADGVPHTERFRVAPRQDVASVYSVELQPDPAELTDGNNTYAVLVRPPGRARRLLLVEGAPGFEHSFVKRAWARDRGLEVDSVVRKGMNDRGEETYYVQAAKGRASSLASGYPSRRDILFNYDLIILANVDAGLLTRDQLALTADFVAERGGGLLMLGARSLAGDGLSRTPLEELMPVEASDRIGRAVVTSAAALGLNRVSLTSDGERHPMMQLGASVEEARQEWSSVPPLGASTGLGTAKPGASVLAITNGPGGRSRPLVAVQRYGHGRTMVFAGEASWRWRMMLPSTNRTYETFWRQAGRWLAAGAPEPIALTLPSPPVGSTTRLDIDVRDAEFRALPDVSVIMRVVDAAGSARDLTPVADVAVGGRHSATFRADHGGLFHVEAEVRRGSERVGTVRDWMLVGGADRELTDPRLNAAVLRRLATDSGGALLSASELGDLPKRLALSAARATDAPRRERELWHTPWAFLLIIGFVSLEWGLRRRWGLR